ncbi:hypothetical protein [Paraburkholderia sp.]|uniref:hypothetical protein n=1 Tax=Paraburkholderia sp. TaxID=1926495 RepID=UPI00239F1BD6|nr:hypothetical protein [Paraburkholderia sp.]MDE1179414.1 hypothetical protein [Paraburkholderia sp.]
MNQQEDQREHAETADAPQHRNEVFVRRGQRDDHQQTAARLHAAHDPAHFHDFQFAAKQLLEQRDRDQIVRREGQLTDQREMVGRHQTADPFGIEAERIGGQPQVADQPDRENHIGPFAVDQRGDEHEDRQREQAAGNQRRTLLEVARGHQEAALVAGDDGQVRGTGEGAFAQQRRAARARVEFEREAGLDRPQDAGLANPVGAHRAVDAAEQFMARLRPAGERLRVPGGELDIGGGACADGGRVEHEPDRRFGQMRTEFFQRWGGLQRAQRVVGLQCAGAILQRAEFERGEVGGAELGRRPEQHGQRAERDRARHEVDRKAAEQPVNATTNGRGAR